MKPILRLFCSAILICIISISATYGTGIAKGYSLPKHSDTLIKWDTIPATSAGDIMVLQLKNNNTLAGTRIEYF